MKSVSLKIRLDVSSQASQHTEDKIWHTIWRQVCRQVTTNISHNNRYHVWDQVEEDSYEIA